MTNDYCEEHEWPGGMGRPCPDCKALRNLESIIVRVSDLFDAPEIVEGRLVVPLELAQDVLRVCQRVRG